MNTEQKSKLRITEVSEAKQSNEEKPRNYRTVRFMEHLEDGILSNAKQRTRNIWEEGPNGSAGDTLYPHLAQQAQNISNGKLGALVFGSIETVHTDKFYIPSEYGKHVDPATNQPANIANSYTSVVFTDETIENIARGQGLTLKSENSTQVEKSPELVEELADESEELVDAPVEMTA